MKLTNLLQHGLKKKAVGSSKTIEQAKVLFKEKVKVVYELLNSLTQATNTK